MILPRVLYNNVIEGITPTWSGTTVADNPPANATDWFDWTTFTADDGNLEYTMSADTTVDCVAIYTAPVSGSNGIQVQYESSAGVFTTLKLALDLDGVLIFDSFTPVTVLSGRKIRFVVSAATTVDIRQIAIGEYLEMQQGQWAGATPPTFNQGIKVTNNISANGSVLGRSIKRLERKGMLKLMHLTASWVRDSWEPFSEHAARYPFFYAWNYRDYTSEVAFATAEQIKAPVNDANGYLSAEMPLRMLVADSEAV